MKITVLQKHLMAITIGASAASSHADHFVELNGRVALDAGEFESDFVQDSVESNSDDYDLGILLYLSDVSSDEQPLAEAGFISRKSYFSYQREKTQFGGPESEVVVNRFAAQINFGAFFGQLDYDEGKIDGIFSHIAANDTEIAHENVRITLGAYTGPTTTLSLEYEDNEAFFIGQASTVIGSKSYGPKIRWLNGEESKIAVEAGIKKIDLDDSDDGLVLDLAVSIYPINTVGINLAFGKTQIETLDYREFEVDIEWFVESYLSFSFGFEAVDAELPNLVGSDDTSISFDQYFLATKVRF